MSIYIGWPSINRRAKGLRSSVTSNYECVKAKKLEFRLPVDIKQRNIKARCVKCIKMYKSVKICMLT